MPRTSIREGSNLPSVLFASLGIALGIPLVHDDFDRRLLTADSIFHSLVTALLAALLLPACKSSAPYTLPAAGINAALAATASVAQRSAGGCYAQCVGGTVCNPNTGFCDSPGAVCLGLDSDPLSCLNRPGTTMDAASSVPVMGPINSPIGISPATGSVPPPPGSRP